MLSTPIEVQALRRIDDLERPLLAVEEHLAGLTAVLRERDAVEIELQALALHGALAAALAAFAAAARRGELPMPLRQRLATAGAQVAAQREALARAVGSLDRAIDVLLPAARGAVYTGDGLESRPASSGQLQG